MSRLLAALLLAAAALPASARVVRIRVLHTNDVHGWILPRKERHGERMVGGAAAFAAWARKERRKGPSLTLDAGDWFQGTPEGTLSHGRAATDVMDAVGYDATTVGNHDFDFGEATLEDLIAHFKTPVLNDNIESASDGRLVPWVRPWVIKDVGGVKVGIFGLLTTGMSHI
ncbi:MAG: metallophosphoesterase, partial [Elusimicrobia bacterium]|nr:metallophosphoesterase [Elusimicrobiota bacterium]